MKLFASERNVKLVIAFSTVPIILESKLRIPKFLVAAYCSIYYLSAQCQKKIWPVKADLYRTKLNIWCLVQADCPGTRGPGVGRTSAFSSSTASGSSTWRRSTWTSLSWTVSLLSWRLLWDCHGVSWPGGDAWPTVKLAWESGIFYIM